MMLTPRMTGQLAEFLNDLAGLTPDSEAVDDDGSSCRIAGPFVVEVQDHEHSMSEEVRVRWHDDCGAYVVDTESGAKSS